MYVADTMRQTQALFFGTFKKVSVLSISEPRLVDTEGWLYSITLFVLLEQKNHTGHVKPQIHYQKVVMTPEKELEGQRQGTTWRPTGPGS